MTRPRFVPDTPSAIHTVNGGSVTLTEDEKKMHLGYAPSDNDIYKDNNLEVVRFRRQYPNEPLPQKDVLQFKFSAAQNTLWLSAVGNQLHLYLDQVLYQITPSSKAQAIELITQDGADAIYVDDNLENPLHILSGAGNDYLRIGGRHSALMTGAGDDTVRITSGFSRIDAGPGDDSIHITSADDAVVYAGPGDDSIRAGGGRSFIDAGPGNDIVIGGCGHTILSGGDGNDTIKAGCGPHVIYPGSGVDHISRLKPFDRVYDQADTRLAALTEQERREWVFEKLAALPRQTAEQVLAVLLPDSRDILNHTLVASSEAGKDGIEVEGTPDFIARVQADLSLLRASPRGQTLLLALDAAAHKSGKTVKINYFTMDNAAFKLPDPAQPPEISAGQPGPAAKGGLIEYNPEYSATGSLPVINLYHELCHAYNAVTGTAVPGETEETEGSTTVQTKNIERQAVGLPIAMAPFDFDFDPTTPPTQTNPEAFTENGIRKEFGLPPRTSYWSSKKSD